MVLGICQWYLSLESKSEDVDDKNKKHREVEEVRGADVPEPLSESVMAVALAETLRKTSSKHFVRGFVIFNNQT